MVTKIILTLITLVVFSCQSSGQVKNLSEDELKKELKTYLLTQNELSEGDSAIIYVVDLSNFDDYNGENGIYKFGVLGPHFLPYIVYVIDNQFNIQKDYTTLSVVGSFKMFIQSNERKYTEIQKAQLLKNLSGVLYTRMKMVEETSIDKDIDY